MLFAFRLLITPLCIGTITLAGRRWGHGISGLLASFPLFATVLTAFAHRQQGPLASTQLLRGLVLGMSATACFLLVVAGLLVAWGLVWTYALAVSSAITVSALSYHWSRANLRN